MTSCSVINRLCRPIMQPIVMHLACVLLHLRMPEALVAATLNAAASLSKSDTHGSLEVGKLADMIVVDAPRYCRKVYEHLLHKLLAAHQPSCVQQVCCLPLFTCQSVCVTAQN